MEAASGSAAGGDRWPLDGEGPSGASSAASWCAAGEPGSSSSSCCGGGPVVLTGGEPCGFSVPKGPAPGAGSGAADPGGDDVKDEGWRVRLAAALLRERRSEKEPLVEGSLTSFGAGAAMASFATWPLPRDVTTGPHRNAPVGAHKRRAQLWHALLLLLLRAAVPSSALHPAPERAVRPEERSRTLPSRRVVKLSRLRVDDRGLGLVGDVQAQEVGLLPRGKAVGSRAPQHRWSRNVRAAAHALRSEL